MAKYIPMRAGDRYIKQCKVTKKLLEYAKLDDLIVRKLLTEFADYDCIEDNGNFIPRPIKFDTDMNFNNFESILQFLAVWVNDTNLLRMCEL